MPLGKFVIFRKRGEEALSEQRGSFQFVATDGKREDGDVNGVPQRIQELQIQHFYEADPAYGTGEAKGLGLNIESIVANVKQASAAV